MPKPFHTFPQSYLTRSAAAKLLTTFGLPTTESRLARLAAQKKGPAYFYWGRHATYHRDALIAWLNEVRQTAVGGR